jgi:hypothetical protein
MSVSFHCVDVFICFVFLFSVYSLFGSLVKAAACFHIVYKLCFCHIQNPASFINYHETFLLL